MKLLNRTRRRYAANAIAMALLGVAARPISAATKDWAQSPYRIHLTLGVDDAAKPQPQLGAVLAAAIEQRVERTIAPLWALKTSVAGDATTRRFCLDPQELAPDKLPADINEFDKLMWLGVAASPRGYELTCREYDAYIRRWGPVHHRTIQQRVLLPEACVDLLAGAFTPLAALAPIADDDAHVQLAFKGAALPRQTDDARFVRPGDVFQPLLRRTDRSGRVGDNGVMPVPWTYLNADSNKENDWLARVHTGMRRPFGAQRGRIEQLAAALRSPPGPRRVRFHARSDAKQGLAGYEVFRQTDDRAPQLLGITDRNGAISIPPSDERIITILLRSDGQLLAKAPFPTGSGPLIEMPVADNIARLRAQSEAQVVREELVDVVARRAIMIARIQALLKKGRVDDARKLMVELDELPTSSTFGRTIDTVQKRIPATDDPSVQRTIDKLFTSTRELLGKFLDRRQIIDLQSEVNAAQPGGS